MIYDLHDTSNRPLWGLKSEIDFLNHGSFGASPKAVLERQNALREIMEMDPVEFIENLGVGLWEEALNQLSDFVNADPAGMAFVPNATTGVNTVLASLKLDAGDKILVTDTTYQACRNAVDAVAERSGCEVNVACIPVPLDDEEYAVEAVLDAVDDRTRLALIDTISSPTGIRMPFERLVKDLQNLGIDVLLDAAHGPGLVPLDIDALNAAYVTGNCHKWLCTPKGSAFLHVREDKRSMRPLVISHGATLPKSMGSRFRLEFDWTGTLDPTPWMCIPFAIEYLASVFPGGWDKIMERNRNLAFKARSHIISEVGLQPVCSEDFVTSMAAFIVPGPPFSPGPDPLHTRLLEKHGVQVPVLGWLPHNRRYLRVSAHLYNSIDQYERLAQALKSELRS